MSTHRYTSFTRVWFGCPDRHSVLGHPSVNDSKAAQNRTAVLPICHRHRAHPPINDSKIAQNRTADVAILTHFGANVKGLRGEKGQIGYFYGMNRDSGRPAKAL
jgi:hypothetical protein